MKTLRFSKTGIIGLLAVLGFLFSATSSFAAGATLQADVQINQIALLITPTDNLSTTMTAPTTANQVFVIGPDGICGSCAGPTTAGLFRVSGNEGSNIDFETLVAPTACTGGSLSATPPQGAVSMGSLTFADLSASPITPGGNFTLTAAVPGTGHQDFNWGASIDVSSDASGGITCTQDIAMNYNP